MVLVADGGGGGGYASAASVNGLVSAITGVPEIVLDGRTVESLRGKLAEARTFLLEAQAEMRAVSASAVGGSPVGAQLAYHSALADTHLRESIDKINLGLDGYDAALATSLSLMQGTDDLVAQDAARGTSSIADATTPTGQQG